MEKTFAVTMLEAANSTSSSKSKKRNMKFLKTTEMSLLKYVMNCTLLQLLLDTKYSKAGLMRWHVQHHHYGWIDWWDVRRSHIFGLFRHGGLPGCSLSEQGNKSWKPTGIMCLVHAARDDATTMMFQETRVSLFEQNLLKSTGRAANQAIRELRDRSAAADSSRNF